MSPGSWGVRPGAEIHSESTPVAAADHRHFGLFPGLACVNRRGHVLRGLHLAAVDVHDLVVRLQTGVRGRTTGGDALDHGTRAVLRRAVADPEVRALDLAAVLDLRDDELDGRHRDGEA